MSNQRCNIWSNNHKDFYCMNCDELVMPGDNTKLNICFSHWLEMCDKCSDEHEYHHKKCLHVKSENKNT